VTATIQVTTSSIRRIDVRRDLLSVAELIEICFSNQMDHDGIEYIRQIRRAAQSPNALRWTQGSHENLSIPLDGYVWSEQGRIVGNLTLIPFLSGGTWRYLIANVAVHPDYRGRGIAKQLTEKALEHVHDHLAHAAWLQVRDDNPIAIHLYRELGFQERTRRATWICEPDSPSSGNVPSGIQIDFRRKTDWEDQEKWLHSVYPPSVTWNLPLRIGSYKPDFWHDLVHWMNGDRIDHWAARRENRLLGLASLELTSRSSDNLWLAVAPEQEDVTVQALLAQTRKNNSTFHTLSVNYPANRATQAFQSAGFSHLNTLIWMEVQFS
jgi:ribosomal protein S18 acetylase RimI-like enzyme